MQRQVPYAQAIATKYPEQVVIGIAKDPQGKCNPISLGWSMITSHAPPMLAVSVGKRRYSLEAFRQARQFVVAFPSVQQARETLVFGTKSGRDADKLALAAAETQPAEKIDCVLLADAVANFECRLVGELETGDHVIFVGEVVCSHVNDRPVGRLYIVGPGHALAGVRRSDQE